MNVKLVKTNVDSEYADFELRNENDVKIVSFEVEFGTDKALISYETIEAYRNQGFASQGLCLLRDYLFQENILILELINLSGDHSRKVAENARFFSGSPNSLDFYLALNPLAENIIGEQIKSVVPGTLEHTKLEKKLHKVKKVRLRELSAKNALREKLNNLMATRELTDDLDYKDILSAEIKHLQNILGIDLSQSADLPKRS